MKPEDVRPANFKKHTVDYSNQLETLYEKLIFNLGQIQKIEKIRDTLLPKLLSGAVRVKT